MRRTKTVPAQRAAAHDSPQASTDRGNFTPPTSVPQPPSDDRADIATTAGKDSGSRFALRNWRVPTRLIAILIIPVLTGLVFAGLRVNSSIDNAQRADEAERLAKLALSATTLADSLQNERDFSAQPLTQRDFDNPKVAEARAKTDEDLKQFEADAANAEDIERVTTRINASRANLAWLDELRDAAYNPKLSPLATQQAYSKMFSPLMAFDNELGFGSSDVTSRGRAVYAISLAKASASTQRALIAAALARDAIISSDPTAIQAATTLEFTANEEFLSSALPEDIALYNKVITDESARAVDGYKARLLTTQPGTSLAKAGLKASTWMALSSAEMDEFRQLERTINERIVTDAQETRADAEQDAIINGAVALLAVIIAGLLTWIVSRTMVRGMGILRTSALDIAESRLPDLVEKLSKTDPGRVDTRVKPIPLFGRDEIGEVARAFDQVHREAVRLAAEQALLRGNVNAIFTNLSRRNQGLIQRQLTLITELENNEADPDQLENLFKLDHLATRMRRNGENLLVLAGEEPGRRWTQPVPLVDVLRAAASEVEQYERVELFGIPDTEIHGAAVNDLVHLLAELLENATTFSSPQTKVRVNGTRLPDGRIMVEIHDKGIGLTPEDFADINHKLANPPTVDVSVARRMGLFVVGRLSARHGIRVQLRPSGEAAGTTSLVMLPEPLTHGGHAPEPEEPEFHVSRVMPQQQQMPKYEGGVRTAAELGFDDSRYEAHLSALDPVNRSLAREERRAAIEAARGGEERQAPERPAFRGELPPYENPPQYLDDSYAAGQPEQDYGQDQYEDAGQYDADAGYDTGAAAYEDHGQYAEAASYGQQVQDPAYDAGTQYDDRQYAQDYAPDQYADYSRNGFQNEDYGSTRPSYTDSAPDSPFGGSERVGFNAPQGPSGAPHSLTTSGLPRPERQWQQPEEPARNTHNADKADIGGADNDDWQSANDQHWQRAAKVREPQAGGVTPSGLPRRVPKANLVPGTAQQTPQGGPQVSRAPEEVRGRLTNLRRGIQQGRQAGGTNGRGFGPNHQER